MTAVSVVIPTLNEGQNLIDTVAGVRANSGCFDPEVVVVDDGSTDGSPAQLIERFAGDERVRVIEGAGLGVAPANNTGAAAAGGDMVVFMDAHCYVPEGWLAPLVAPLADPKIAMTGPAFTSIRDPRQIACGVTWVDPSLHGIWLPMHTSGPVPFHIGACQAMRIDAFNDVGGFDPKMTCWGSEDLELCLRLWLMGYEIHATPASLCYHLFRTSRPYHIDHHQVLYNHLRMALLHFDESRITKVIAKLMGSQGVERALAMACTNGIGTERERLFATRTHDIDWFFDRFGIGF